MQDLIDSVLIILTAFFVAFCLWLFLIGGAYMLLWSYGYHMVNPSAL